MYLLESFVGSVIKLLILDKLFPGWAQNLVLVVCFSIIMVILWVLILKKWIKFGQIGSYDWMTGQIKKKMRKILTTKELKITSENSNTIINTES